jgi:hypothetical protein
VTLLCSHANIASWNTTNPLGPSAALIHQNYAVECSTVDTMMNCYAGTTASTGINTQIKLNPCTDGLPVLCMPVAVQCLPCCLKFAIMGTASSTAVLY